MYLRYCAAQGNNTNKHTVIMFIYKIFTHDELPDDAKKFFSDKEKLFGNADLAPETISAIFQVLLQECCLRCKILLAELEKLVVLSIVPVEAISVTEAAKRLGVQRNAVYVSLQNGRLTTAASIGTAVLVDEKFKNWMPEKPGPKKLKRRLARK